jgi:hypothetical protein
VRMRNITMAPADGTHVILREALSAPDDQDADVVEVVGVAQAVDQN